MQKNNTLKWLGWATTMAITLISLYGAIFSYQESKRIEALGVGGFSGLGEAISTLVLSGVFLISFIFLVKKTLNLKKNNLEIKNVSETVGRPHKIINVFLVATGFFIILFPLFFIAMFFILGIEMMDTGFMFYITYSLVALIFLSVWAGLTYWVSQKYLNK